MYYYLLLKMQSTGDLLASNSVNSVKIADESIQNTDIRNGTLTGNKIADGQVVKSINGIKDEVIIEEGENVEIRRNGNRIKISAESGNSNIKSIRGSATIGVENQLGNYVLNLKTPLHLNGNQTDPTLSLRNAVGPVNVSMATSKVGISALRGSNVGAVIVGDQGGVYGFSFDSKVPAGRFNGSVEVVGQTRLFNRGAGSVLLNLDIERSWHLRQFGSGAGTALEFASVGGGGNKNFLINTEWSSWYRNNRTERQATRQWWHYGDRSFNQSPAPDDGRMTFGRD